MMDRKRLPLNGTFELTGRCNLCCPMCLVRVDQKRIKELQLRELTAEEWIYMAKQARDAGTLSLLLTGGEAMLRSDFCEIYEAIAQMGFFLTLYTNATIVTDKVMDVLKRFPPHKIGVTMYGASNETYARMCGCADGYDRFLNGVNELSKLPSIFDIRTTIIKQNLHDLQAMREYTRKTFGEKQILHISRQVINSVRGAVANPRMCRLSPEENANLCYEDLMNLYQRVKNGEVDKNTFKNKLYLKRVHLSKDEFIFNHCNAGITDYAINWSGHMYACELLAVGYTEPNLVGFQKAWDELPKKYPLSREISECDKCEASFICDACPAIRMAETGDWFGIPKNSCRETKVLKGALDELNILG